MFAERFQDAAGKWKTRWRVSYTDAAGSKRKRSFNVKTDAIEFEASLHPLKALKEAAANRGISPQQAIQEKAHSLSDVAVATIIDAGHVKVETKTFSEMAEEFLESCEKGIRTRAVLAPNTVRFYRHKLGLASKTLGTMPVNIIKKFHIQDAIDGLIKDGLSRKTAITTLTSVKTLFGWLLDLGEIPVNPAIGCKVPVTARERDQGLDFEDIYTDQQVAEIFDQMGFTPAEVRDRAAIALGFYAGLRIGEVLALEWHHLDFERRQIDVTQSAHDRTGEIQHTKTVRSRRFVPMNRKLLEYLEPFCAMSGPNPQGRVFVTPSGKPLIQRNLLRSLQQAQKKAGHADIRTFHEARHYYVSRLIEKGFNIKRIATLIGHVDEALTLRVYGHLMNRSTRREQDFEDLSAAFD